MEDSRRNAIKAALAAVSFVPVVAAATAQTPSSPNSPQGSSTNSGSTKKRQPRPDLQQKPTPRTSRNRLATKQAPTPAAGNIHNQLPQDQAAALDKAISNYKASSSATASPIATLPLHRLAAQFRYASTHSLFSQIRCDLLAAEASQAVARCLQLRQEWESTFEASYAFLSDIDRFNRLDAIFRLEEANGVYDLDSESSQGELQAAYAAVNPLSNAAGAIESIYNDMVTNFHDQYGWIQLLGWLSHISGYGSSGSATAQVSWNGNTDTVVDYCYKAAVAQGETQLNTQINQLYAGYQALNAQANATNSRIPALQAKATWDTKNKQFRQLQVQALRDLYAIKQQLAGQSGGPLNYAERLTAFQSVFDVTLSDALERFSAIRDGLLMLFGLDIPIPANVSTAIQNPGQPQPSDAILDSAAAWLDSIGRWTSRFSAGEQAYTMCLSIKDAVTRDAWQAFLSSGNLVIPVPREIFPDQFYVRCRSIGMYTRGLEGFFSARVALPQTGIYVHRDLTVHSVNQEQIPLQRLSRIVSIDSSRITERVGLNTAYNCSPIGEWRLSCAEKSSDGSKREHLHDLYLEIVVTEQ